MGLKIPDNIVLVFLPPYSPELNPAEKVWWVLKREINLQVFKTMNELQMYLDKVIKKTIIEENIIQLTSYQRPLHGTLLIKTDNSLFIGLL